MDSKDIQNLKEAYLKIYDELDEGKVEWDNPKKYLPSGLTPREKNRAKRISIGVENPNETPSEKQLERYGKLKIAHDDQKEKKVPRNKRHRFSQFDTGPFVSNPEIKRRELKSKLKSLKEPKESYDIIISQQLDEISLKTKIKAYAATQDPEADYQYGRKVHAQGDRLKAAIVKKHGEKAGEHADAHADASHWGRKDASGKKKGFAQSRTNNPNKYRTRADGKMHGQDQNKLKAKLKKRMGIGESYNTISSQQLNEKYRDKKFLSHMKGEEEDENAMMRRKSRRKPMSPDQQKKYIDKYEKKEQVDIYDLILSHLLDEGYAETPEAANVIMVNMSEDWRESIVEDIINEISDRKVSAVGKKRQRNVDKAMNSDDYIFSKPGATQKLASLVSKKTKFDTLNKMRNRRK